MVSGPWHQAMVDLAILGRYTMTCQRGIELMVRLLTMVVMAGLLSACAQKKATTWKVFPLQRNTPHDGLAVVSQPDGYGVHLYLETETSDPGVCSPRWLPDSARLFNGNGSAPFSSGLAPRSEFLSAVNRRDVRNTLKQELEALCKLRAPKARWQWLEPPLNPSELTPVSLPALEHPDLLTDPVEEQEREDKLLKED
ncbi:putative conserved lipoprotein [Synechococcus sp. PROS-9-1]|nr:putative conserved lipoprotein [Synechococcus sp. PROS-9-1]